MDKPPNDPLKLPVAHDHQADAAGDADRPGYTKPPDRDDAVVPA